MLTIMLVLLAMPLTFPHLSAKPRRLKEMFAIEETRKVDFLGTFLLLAACVLLISALEEGGTEYSWHSPVTLVLLVCSLFLWAAFILWENVDGRRGTARENILPWRVVTNRFSMGILL